MMTEEVNATAVPRQFPLGSLLASAKRLTSTRLSGSRAVNIAKPSQWQSDAWEMFDLVGEERYLITTLANRLSKARLYIGKLDPNDPTAQPTAIEDETINSILGAVGGTPAGRAQIMERIAINLGVTGDGWLVGIPRYVLEKKPRPSEPVDIADFDWRFLSVSEITTRGTEVEIEYEMGQRLTANVNDLYLIRIWRPHPRRMWEADCATRASLPVLKELVGLTMHVSAQIDSRLAGAGILVVASSIQEALRQSAQVPEEATDDQFTQALIEAMSTAIQDRGSAAAVVPLVVTVPDEAMEGIKHISFANNLDGSAQALREESIRRLALGQDAPPEILLGTGGMNHWGGWLVQSDVVSTHIEPPLALICDALTTEYLWPVLEQTPELLEGISDVKDFKDVVIWYDVSHLVVHPNRSSDAFSLHERNVISDEALRRSAGFDEDDAPQSKEIADQVAEIVIEMFKGNPALINRPGLGVLMQQLKDVLQGLEPEVYDPRKAAEEARQRGETPPGEAESTGPSQEPGQTAPAATPAAQAPAPSPGAPGAPPQAIAPPAVPS